MRHAEHLRLAVVNRSGKSKQEYRLTNCEPPNPIRAADQVAENNEDVSEKISDLSY